MNEIEIYKCGWDGGVGNCGFIERMMTSIRKSKL
jgi:hypothetical protein